MNAENTNRSKLNKMIRYFQYGKFHCLQYIGHAKKLKSDCKDAIYSEQNILRFLYFFAASC